ncbi:Pre-mRNA-splicing factor slt11 [Coemansia sp. RSA 2611]|nr:Pre-mRNA-splicing factor slt11 [Coemansia sp. RSA 2708]KAJ2363910.1 Pre-mRNA-splicing factor slt11 [Coemansia sp. RSA 2610]KAJ2383108.1 Pre-mRNA-splicing factor slt11 [Coemansia sp. RSA 2611]
MADADEPDFPILCETCLGPNPYVRMTREVRGAECKICTRAFTVFRWQPGRGMRYKKTELCAACARLKNVCQTCVLDLAHGLPVQVRDAVLGQQQAVPTQPSNRRDHVAKLAAQQSAGDAVARAEPAARAELRRMARTAPYYARNRAHVCSFFARGQCTRGATCPYRHELPDGDAELARQNISDRYHGANDPVARRMLARAAPRTDRLAPPADASVTSLFAADLDPAVTDAALRAHFSAFGELKSVVVAAERRCAFVNFRTRAAAEAAARAALDAGGRPVVAGAPVKLAWGRARPKGPRPEAAGSGGSSGAYPSQDPTAEGSVKQGS